MGVDNLEYGVLGTLEVRRDGALVPLSSPRQRALLAALLVGGRDPISPDALIEAVWGDALPTSPRSALYTVLSRLRSVVGAEAIISEPGGYRLDRDDEALDARRFEMLATRAETASPEEALKLLDSALALWRGRAYSEFGDCEFATAEAVRLDELYLRRLEDRAELLLETGEHEDAAVELGSFVEKHPFRERARRLLMAALYGSGRGTDALEMYQIYRRLLAEELGLEPGPILQDLELSILRHDVPGVSSVGHSEPTAQPRWLETDTAFVGRDDDVVGLVEEVRRFRLVTLTGPGGVGKTRLAAECLPSLSSDPGVPITVVELRGVDGQQVVPAIAEAVGIGGALAIAEATLDYLRVTPSLLVLDNCEHVIEEIRSFVSTALRACPDLQIVCTSRRRTGLPAEKVFPVGPLGTPSEESEASVAELTAAMRLFTDRTRRVRPSFSIEPTNVQAVAEICRRLDGLPLAIELAASRVATLGLEPVRRRLDQSLNILSDLSFDGDRSLRATLQLSFDLLDKHARDLFAMLGVFESDFGLEMVESVAASLGYENVALCLAELVDSSLVVDRGPSDNPRFRLLETVNAFAREHLVAGNVENRVRQAHAQWVLSIVEGAADSAVTPGEPGPLGFLNEQRSEIRSAVTWAVESEEPVLAGRITGALALAFQWQGHREQIGLLRRVGDDPVLAGTDVWSFAHAAAGFAAAWQGDLEAAENAATEALDSARTIDDRFLALCTLGIVTLYERDFLASRRWWRQLLALEGLAPARQLHGHASLALIARYEENLPEAREHVARAVAVAKTGSDAYIAFAQYISAEVIAAEDPAAAVPFLTEAMRNAGRARAEFVAAVASVALATVLVRLHRVTEVVDVLGHILDRLLRLAAWPHLWNALRILAEVLADQDSKTALLILAAADQAKTAPLADHDYRRFERLVETLHDEVGQVDRLEITTLASVLPRTEIVARARVSIDDLRDGVEHE